MNCDISNDADQQESHRIENPRVGGSIPPQATNAYSQEVSYRLM
jgi:hypothetical protein